MRAYEILFGKIEQLEVDWLTQFEVVGPCERVIYFVEVEVVVIGFAYGAELGVEMVRDGICGFNSDVVGQEAIEGCAEALRIVRDGRFEMGDLSMRVYAGVGAARSVEDYGFFKMTFRASCMSA